MKENKHYLQEALKYFNGGNWWNWEKYDNQGNKIPNSERMQYKYIKIIKEGATMPSEVDVNAKIQEIKDEENTRKTRIESAKTKLQDLGLTPDEVKDAFNI